MEAYCEPVQCLANPESEPALLEQSSSAEFGCTEADILILLHALPSMTCMRWHEHAPYYGPIGKLTLARKVSLPGSSMASAAVNPHAGCTFIKHLGGPLLCGKHITLPLRASWLFDFQTAPGVVWPLTQPVMLVPSQPTANPSRAPAPPSAALWTYCRTHSAGRFCATQYSFCATRYCVNVHNDCDCLSRSPVCTVRPLPCHETSLYGSGYIFRHAPQSNSNCCLLQRQRKQLLHGRCQGIRWQQQRPDLCGAALEQRRLQPQQHVALTAVSIWTSPSATLTDTAMAMAAVATTASVATVRRRRSASRGAHLRCPKQEVEAGEVGPPKAHWSSHHNRRRQSGVTAGLRLPSLVLSLLVAVALQGIMVSVPCAAAEWSWMWDKSKTASTALGAATAPTPSSSRHFSGVVMPYGWRKHNEQGQEIEGRHHSRSPESNSGNEGINAQMTDAAAGHSISASERGGIIEGGNREGENRGGVDDRVSVVKFSAGRVPVEVNAAGNVTALMEYDPYNRPPPRPPTPLLPKDPKKRKAAVVKGHRVDPPTPPDAQLALRELLSSRRLPFDPTQPYKQPAMSYKSSDFVFATASCPSRYILAQSTRCWRRGIRAFIAVNNTEDLALLNDRNRAHHEHYSYFPDDGSAELGPVFHGFMPGDTRAAMAPFLAHQHFGETYKWLLYGDDDTVFYTPSVKRLLAHLDPELPIALSDNLWFRARHPNLLAPRCLPCHLAVDADPEPTPTEDEEGSQAAGQSRATTLKPSKVLKLPNITTVMDGYLRFLLGSKTTVDLTSSKVQKLLKKNTYGDFNKTQAAIANLPLDTPVPGVRYLPRPACPFCTAAAACTPMPAGPDVHNVSGAGCFASGGHGGAGMIFSVGLLRRLDPERMKRCYMKIIKAPGGDGMLSSCMWEEGYAFTDPGASVLAQYDGNYLMFSSEAGKWMLHDPLAVLLKGRCDGRCKWLLRNAASHHGRGRHFQNFEQSAAYLYGNMASYTATHKWLAFMATRDIDLAALEGLVGPQRQGQEQEG